ncbi:M13 family peptidase [bacterium CPR1]|nr:M13 family peptidase [bacterium CPR1]
MLTPLGPDPVGKSPPPPRLAAPPAATVVPEDVAQLQSLASAGAPRQRVLARVALALPDSQTVAAQAARSATLQAISQGVSGPLAVALAEVAVKAMQAQIDLKARAEVGHLYLSAIAGLNESQSQPAGNVLRLVTLQDPLAAQSYQTSLLTMLPAREEPGPAVRQKLGKEDPGDNFFEHANGRVNRFWRSLLGFSEGHRYEVSGKQARQLSKAIWKEMLSAPGPQPGSPEQKVQDFHQAASDMKLRDQLGLSQVRPLLEQIEAMQDHSEVGPILSMLHRQGIPTLLTPDLYPMQDGTLRFSLMPNRDRPGSDLNRAIHDRKFASYATELLEAAGDPPEAAAGNARRASQAAFQLAGADCTSKYDPNTRSHDVRLQKMQELDPALGWSAYQTPTDVLMTAPRHLETLSEQLRQVPLEELKQFLRYSVLSNLACDLTSELSEAHDRSDRRLQRYSDRSPESQTKGYLQTLLQQRFAEKAVTAEKRRLAEQVFEDVRGVFRERIRNATWYTPQARQEALDKLERMTLEVGSPASGYEPLAVEIKNDRHLENVMRIKGLHASKVFNCDPSLYGWGRTDLVNAYHLPKTNTVAVTGAYLLDPRLEGSPEPAELYGVLGYTMGHEVAHGFEGSGTRHDGSGAQRDWLPPQDRQMLEMKLQGVERQLRQFEPAFGERNRASFVNESSADLTGLSVAYEAFLQRNHDRTVKEGLTPEQRFFLNFATSLSRRHGSLRERDPDSQHPANEFRVNNAVRNMPAFAAAFALAPGAPMAFEQGRRAGLW